MTDKKDLPQNTLPSAECPGQIELPTPKERESLVKFKDQFIDIGCTSQEEARALCKKKDHSWLHDDKYEGIAYARKDESLMDEHTVKIGGATPVTSAGSPSISPLGNARLAVK